MVTDDADGIKSTPRWFSAAGAAAFVALAFGAVTLVVGGAVLLGRDTGYDVYSPLLVYNVVMGFAYVAAGLMIRRTAPRSPHAALAIFLANAGMLWWIFHVHAANPDAVAPESFRAMTMRTVVWFILWLAATALVRQRVHKNG